MDAAKQKHDEQMVERYTGLNPGQLVTLKLARKGDLRVMSAARREAMDGLISGKMTLTPRGIDIEGLVIKLAVNDYYIGPRAAAKEYSTHIYCAIARRANQELQISGLREHWCRNVHLRVMAELYNYGCLSRRWLNKVYGGNTVDELEKAGMVTYDHPVWPIYSLTPAGMEKLRDWGLI